MLSRLTKGFLFLLLAVTLASCASSKKAPLTVTKLNDPNPAADYAAEIVNFDLPKKLETGKTYNASITLKNTGDNTWIPEESYRLGVTANASPFGATRIDLANPVIRDGEFTFKFDFTAPSAPGAYSAQYQMLRESVRWFGDILDVRVEIKEEQ